MNAPARWDLGSTYVEAEREGRLGDPLLVLQARAEARAYLWSQCVILDLLDAVDEIQICAEQLGWVDLLGQDTIQHCISTAFGPHIARNKIWLEWPC
jgi:hypothetical protein